MTATGQWSHDHEFRPRVIVTTKEDGSSPYIKDWRWGKSYIISRDKDGKNLPDDSDSANAAAAFIDSMMGTPKIGGMNLDAVGRTYLITKRNVDNNEHDCYQIVMGRDHVGVIYDHGTQRTHIAVSVDTRGPEPVLTVHALGPGDQPDDSNRIDTVEIARHVGYTPNVPF